MKKLNKILGLVLGAVLIAAAAGGAVWWQLGGTAKSGDAAKAEAPKKPAPDYKYVMLDKVLVMLRGGQGSAISHYMAVDVVFKVLPEHEKRAKEHLPLLRAVAVKALSSYTLEGAQAMSVSQFAEVLNKAYRDSYAAEGREAPFADALVGKLIIE